MGDIPRHYRVGLIQVVKTLLNNGHFPFSPLRNCTCSIYLYLCQYHKRYSLKCEFSVNWRYKYYLLCFLLLTISANAKSGDLCLLISFYFFQLVHFVNRDSLGLANDFLSLGFIPEGVDIQSVSDALRSSFGDGTRHSQDFQVCTRGLYMQSSRILLPAL